MIIEIKTLKEIQNDMIWGMLKRDLSDMIVEVKVDFYHNTFIHPYGDIFKIKLKDEFQIQIDARRIVFAYKRTRQRMVRVESNIRLIFCCFFGLLDFGLLRYNFDF